MLMILLLRYLVEIVGPTHCHLPTAQATHRDYVLLWWRVVALHAATFAEARSTLPLFYTESVGSAECHQFSWGVYGNVGGVGW